jgi:hypothetical protein
MAAGGEKYDSSWSGRVFIAQSAEMISSSPVEIVNLNHLTTVKVKQTISEHLTKLRMDEF